MSWPQVINDIISASTSSISASIHHCTNGLSSALDHLPNPKSVLRLSLEASQIPLHPKGGHPAVCSKPELSCHSKTAPATQDTCCINYPGGQFLQTQFWDTNPPVGPADSWTIHGVWPDHCDGGFDQYCDDSRSYNNVSAILKAAGEDKLLEYMHDYWKAYSGSDDHLWSHEWNKHGTCISTLETKCYSDYRPQEEVVAYFEKAVSLFKSLPSFEALAARGIFPSTTKTYTFSELQTALSAIHGSRAVTIQCRSGTLSEIWYHFDVLGSVQTGTFIPSDPDGPKSSCPKTGIRYLPKKPAHVTTTSTTIRATVPPSPTSSGAPFEGKGYLEVYTTSDDAQTGCIISKGTWFTSGTCATFVAKADAHELDFLPTESEAEHLFTLTSSKGPCAFRDDGVFGCSDGNLKQDIFSVDADGRLTFKNSTSFWAEGSPRGRGQVEVYAEEPREGGVELEIRWKGK